MKLLAKDNEEITSCALKEGKAEMPECALFDISEPALETITITWLQAQNLLCFLRNTLEERQKKILLVQRYCRVGAENFQKSDLKA